MEVPVGGKAGVDVADAELLDGPGVVPQLLHIYIYIYTYI